ncbi:Catechol 2,3-dioxygenase [Sphingobium faniae]|nr:Catechol 2,3-dioxygenase [Sphingobium faniae]
MLKDDRGIAPSGAVRMTERSFHVVATIHTSYTVTDLDATIAFYRDCLGFDIRTASDPGGTYMENITGVPRARVKVAIVNCPGGHQIELFQYLAPQDRERYIPRPCDTGASHMAFRVDDFDAALAKMAEYGFTPLNKTPDVHLPSGAVLHTAYLRNADGLLIEIVQSA